MKNVLLLLTVAIALSACTPTPTPEPGPTPNPAPTPTTTPKPLFIPIPGALVGSGDGTKEGTVYVSPTADEIEVMKLVNEVRTKGTVNGVPATAGTCVDGTWKALPALTYNGLFAYAARKHADYLKNVGYVTHEELDSGSPYFYGAVPRDRVIRAYRELANLEKSYTGTNSTADGGELAGFGYAGAQDMVKGWLNSTGHCQALMNAGITQVGAASNTIPDPYVRTWALIVGR